MIGACVDTIANFSGGMRAISLLLSWPWSVFGGLKRALGAVLVFLTLSRDVVDFIIVFVTAASSD